MTNSNDRRDASGRLLDRRVMCVLVGAGHLGMQVIRALERTGVTGIVVAERERPPVEMNIALTAPRLPHFEPPPLPKDTRPYWRRFEKRRNT